MPRKPPPTDRAAAAAAPRIIGGDLRGRRLEFAPDARTRPMKDRVRETLFDLLGPAVRDSLALDLFAGSGALGFEALSRGAARAVFVERHFPTAETIGRTARALGVGERVEVRPGDALAWAKRPLDLPAALPWLVFVSPPWSLFRDRGPDLMALVAAVMRAGPRGTTVVVESDESFDAAALPDPGSWRTRPLPPAVLHLREGLVS